GLTFERNRVQRRLEDFTFARRCVGGRPRGLVVMLSFRSLAGKGEENAEGIEHRGQAPDWLADGRPGFETIDRPFVGAWYFVTRTGRCAAAVAPMEVADTSPAGRYDLILGMRLMSRGRAPCVNSGSRSLSASPRSRPRRRSRQRHWCSARRAARKTSIRPS